MDTRRDRCRIITPIVCVLLQQSVRLPDSTLLHHQPGQIGRSIDDSSSIFDHRKQFLREKENAFHLDIRQVVKLFLSCFCKRPIYSITSIVHEKIKLLGLPFVLKQLLELPHEPIKGFSV